MNVKIRNKFIEIKYRVSNGLELLIENGLELSNLIEIKPRVSNGLSV